MSAIQCFLLAASLCCAPLLRAQSQLPEPGAAKSVRVPAVQEVQLDNGLTVVTVERSSAPIVTALLLVKVGAASEPAEKAGLANFTASLLTKGTTKRSATEVAEAIEFLGASIDSSSDWNSSYVSVTAPTDKLERALEILSDVVRNPAFAESELELLRSQSLDSLTYSLTQPGFIASYVASKLSYGEHPARGTPKSLKGITVEDVKAFHQNHFTPRGASLIFTGDISSKKAAALAKKFFGDWSASGTASQVKSASSSTAPNVANRIVVVDLPNSGQAAVSYRRRLGSVGRGQPEYYAASVLNSVLGGGYSARLNQEIRIKRGLSYGAGSSFIWRQSAANFSASAQTKNESAPEVIELMLAEVKRLADGSVEPAELTPRKAVLTGSFGRDLETTVGLASALAQLYSYGIPTTELNAYVSKVEGISAQQIAGFARSNILGGDVIVVGDYAKFKEDLARKFPNQTVTVLKATELDM